MNLKEAAVFLGYTREKIEELTEKGMPLPRSKVIVKMTFSTIGGEIDVSEEQLDEFIDRFAEEDPERHPRVAVRRELLVESGHACAICRQGAPPQFHHILEWSKIKHHDPAHMMHLCGTCHDRCGSGQIDKKSQEMYKARLLDRVSNLGPMDTHRETKHTADRKVFKDMFEGVPRPIIERFIDVAEYEQIAIPCFSPLEHLILEVARPSFHLFDKVLFKLLEDFLVPLESALHLSGSIFFDYRHDFQIATLMDSRGEHFEGQRAEFQRHIAMTKQAFSILNTYIREQFPELDLDECELIGMKHFNEVRSNPEQ